MRKYRKPYRVKRKIPFYKRKIFWIPPFLILIFFGISYLIIFSSFFQIKTIRIFWIEESKKELENLVEAQTTKNLFSFQTKSIFLLNLPKINQLILEKFPQIETVEFKRKFPNKLELEVKERTPVIIFCSEKCFLTDRDAIAFKEFSEEPKFKIEKLNREKIELGKAVIEKRILLVILEIRETLENDFKIPLEEIIFVSEERINIKTLEGWEIYFNPQEDINWQITKLKAVLDEEIPSQKRENLEYIELRFGNFAPYKYRQSIDIENKD
ncbi:hypothetical protein AMJ49_03285 [Parcubacteria bacterium DG_74_2]|nr:MAG: hypothetical protein AMJ49_03285 [Parcubacteria bacterium DG_74_2]